MSDPSIAVAQAMASVRGQRTGVLIAKKGSIPVDKNSGMEDINSFWDSAKSPNPSNIGASSKSKKPLKQNNSKEDRKQRRAKEKVKPRFSLPNSKEDDLSLSTASHPSAQVNKFLARAAAFDTKAEWSPSDLSRVSTAPPTPATADTNHKSQVEVEEELQMDVQEDIPYSPPEAARASPTEVDEGMAQQKSTGENTSVDGFPVTHEDSDHDDALLVTASSSPLDDDDDDLMPPPPDDDEEVDLDMMDGADLVSPGKVAFPSNVDDDEHDIDDDDKEGEGFNMVHDPETPERVRAERIQEENEVKAQQAERKKKRKKNVTTPKPKKSSRSKKVTYFSPLGYPAGHRDYEAVPVSDYKESPAEKHVRRSRRAKMAPLAYWKNERPLYEAHDERGVLGEAMGDMPVVASVMTALPTPYRKRKVPANMGGMGRLRQKGGVANQGTVGHSDTPFDDSKLRKKYEIANGEVAHLWDEGQDDARDMKVVSHVENMVSTKLPLPQKSRSKGDGKVVGSAAQAFNIETDENNVYMGYIMGKLELPPKGIKDSEAVGGCSQTFTVCNCQPGALEVAYADPHSPDGVLDPSTAQRFLLSPGDMFRIPPGNCYRIDNHSKTSSCLLTWTIIRPRLVQP